MDGPGPLSAVEAAVIEANALALGVPLPTLIANAGRALAEEAAAMLPPAPAAVALLIGPGQNGGDGCEAAVHLAAWGHRPRLFFLPAAAVPRAANARQARVRAEAVATVAPDPPNAGVLAETALIVDALLGVGHRAPLREEFRAACRAANESGVPILAVDVPTGLGDPDGIAAERTVAFTAPKVGAPPDRTGEVRVRDIGVPPSAWQETGPGEFLWWPTTDRLPRAGRAGRVVVLGGGPYAGAPALTALAALRAGAERATVLTPESVAPTVQGFSPNLVVRAIGRDRLDVEFAGLALETIAGSPVEAIVAGPGAGTHPGTLDFFRKVFAGVDPSIPWVLDADALPMLDPGAHRPDPSAREVVATPNAGEFERRLAALGPGETERGDGAPAWAARQWGVTVLVKGPTDRIAQGERAARNLQHHPSMAVAGAGDVLDGVLAASLSAGIPAWGAARLAAYWLGECGRRVGAVRGGGMLATDLIEGLPEVPIRVGESLHRGLGAG